LKKEQKRRFLERLEEPQKNWTFSKAKLREFGAAKQGLLAGK
jgi:polyphosphate kinase 2 (PPK2 family)